MLFIHNGTYILFEKGKADGFNGIDPKLDKEEYLMGWREGVLLRIAT